MSSSTHPPLMLGGQAVIEGVMMRSPRFVSVATRAPGGGCAVESLGRPSLVLSRPWLRAPIVRGVAALIDGLSVGTWALIASARRADPAQPAVTRGMISRTLARALTISIALFFLLPALAARAFGHLGTPPLDQNLVEGGIRIALVLGFLASIGCLPAIRRVFQYHGAEHKAVNAYEAGLPLDTVSVRAASRFHPRCGTTFLFIVLLVAIAVFAVLGRAPLAAQLAERVVLLPLVAGVSYELLRLGQRAPVFGALAAPGLWLQRLTTREPDDEQLAVALLALREVLAGESSALEDAGGGLVPA